MQLAKWDYFRSQKEQKLKEIAKRQQIKQMLRFWSGVCMLRQIIKKAFANKTEKLDIMERKAIMIKASRRIYKNSCRELVKLGATIDVRVGRTIKK